MIDDDATRRILPLAGVLGLGVPVNRPFGQGGLLHGRFLAELLEAGLRGWTDALLRWAPSDDLTSVVRRQRR